MLQDLGTASGPYRYAVYYVPPVETPLAAIARGWLGRDMGAGDGASPPASELVVEAWRYGFHATLQPPFRLADGRSEAELIAAVTALAERTPVVAGPPLRLAEIDGFLALVPAGSAPAVRALADACVEACAPFRHPPDLAELARRRSMGLTPRQDALLARWGYPYVFEEYRFHMTLTRRLLPGERAAVEPRLNAMLAPLGEIALAIDAVTLCIEPAPNAPFMVHTRFPLASSPSPLEGEGWGGG